MKHEQMIEALEAAATKLGVRVRHDAINTGVGSSNGGLCRVKGEWWLIVDKKATPAEKVGLLVDALSTFDTEPLGLPPKIREAIELHRTATGRTRSSVVPTS